MHKVLLRKLKHPNKKRKHNDSFSDFSKSYCGFPARCATSYGHIHYLPRDDHSTVPFFTLSVVACITLKRHLDAPQASSDWTVKEKKKIGIKWKEWLARLLWPLSLPHPLDPHIFLATPYSAPLFWRCFIGFQALSKDWRTSKNEWNEMKWRQHPNER